MEKRLKHGCYRSLDELGKLRGMGKHRLAMVKPYLKVNGVTNGLALRACSNGSSSSSWNVPQACSTPRVNNVGRKTTRINREKVPTPRM